MGVFSEKRSESLVKKSDGIVDVFRSTMTKLADVNTEIEAEETVLKEKQREIAKERDLIRVAKEQNEKIVSKIQAFFE